MSQSGGILNKPVAILDNFGLGGKVVVAIIGILLLIFVYRKLGLQTNTFFGVLLTLAPLWLPIVTFKAFFPEWMDYVQKEYDVNAGRVTLEIKIPQEIFKSPEAMELVLISLHQKASPDNHKETYIDGKHVPTFALEIVSRGGDLKFYINAPRKKFKILTESQLYAHYPGIEVHELELDYTAEIPWDPKRFMYFGIHFGLKKADAYPIKTYIEYGLDKLPKEEEKIDPLNSLLEMMGSIGPGEQMWTQILINANRAYTFKEGSLTDTPDWTEDARAVVKSIIDNAVLRAGAETKGNVMMLLTESEKETVKAIERSTAKNAFNTAIRVMYITEQDKFNVDQLTGITTIWRPFDDNNRNSIGIKWRTDYDWNWWQDPSGRKRDAMKANELEEYKLRIYHPQSISGGDTKTVFTTEELATIFHLPGKVATTPSLGRIPSKRAEAPSNLPV